MLLVLKRGMRRHGLELVVQTGRTHADLVGEDVNGQRLGVMALDPLNRPANPLRQAVMDGNLAQTSALLAGQQAVQNFAHCQRRE